MEVDRSPDKTPKLDTAEMASSSSPSSKLLLRFVKISRYAFAPTKTSPLSAGYDLRSAYNYVIPPRAKQVVMTDLQISVPSGTYGRLAPRSGLAAKSHIDVGGGVIDADYRGNVGVILFNLGQEEFLVRRGERIAQLVCEKVAYPDLLEVDHLPQTERGEGGFGSSGMI